MVRNFCCKRRDAYADTRDIGIWFDAGCVTRAICHEYVSKLVWSEPILRGQMSTGGMVEYSRQRHIET